MEALGNFKRTQYNGTFREAHVDETHSVCGWVQRARNLGGLLFVDLRDRSGIVQCVFDESVDAALFSKASAIRSEYVLGITGKIRKRGGGINEHIPTGTVELVADELCIFSEAETPPFEIVEDSQVNEVLRMTYRYLDLRRPDMQKILAVRSKVMQITREYFSENNFYEIETPYLTKSTPEGARDYLVPSRVHEGKFYALPQSPQQYKQLLMLAGFDRYMQIVRCFRDEDLRADRQPEFTQIDLEMSFVDMEEMMSVNEGFLQALFKKVLDVDITLPIERLPYTEAMNRFGSDKPDLRFGFELQDISALVKDCEFKVFSGAVQSGGSVRAILVDGGAEQLTRKEIDRLAEWVKTYRAKGLAYMRLLGGEMTSSFAKFLSEAEVKSIIETLGAKDGDCIFIVADKNEVVFDSLGALRVELARRLNRIEAGTYRLAWIYDFPLFEYDEEENRFAAKHHPFTAPRDEDLEKLTTDPASCRAKAYDIVINGYEVGGGSLRIHRSDVQRQMFSALGFSDEEANDRFGHLIRAFSYGAPPHGGLAYGLDRLVMILAGTENIKDVIAFPKMQNAAELMMQSPDVVDTKQLDELFIQLKNTEQ